MSDVSALESRITAALDRIRKGIDASASTGSGDAALEAALQSERTTNEALEERVRVLKERQDKQVAALTDRVESQRAQMASLDAELQRLRASNVEMREMSAQLREAVDTGEGAGLVDAALAAEVAALKVQRSADAAEIDAILAELKPLVEEASHAAD